MATFMERTAETVEWCGTPQTDADVLSGEHLSLFAPALFARGRSRTQLLTRMIQAEILPRLARVHKAEPTGPVDAVEVTTEDDSEELVRLLLAERGNDAVAFVDLLRQRGATPASLYLGVVTQAAQRLGELWEQDRCDFVQVTVGVGRLQQAMRAISPHFQTDAVRRAQADSLLLVPAPGEQHTFGLVMLAEFFMREGWHVTGGPVTAAADAAAIVRRIWIDVAGFSIGSASRLDALAQCIQAVRRSSQNPRLFVMVGGPLFLTHPDLVTRVGADTAAADADSAVRQARGLLATRPAAD